MVIRKLIIALLCLLMPLSVQAFEGEIFGERLTAKNSEGIEVLIDYDVKWKLSHLLGEPTRNLVIRWDLADVAWDQWYGEELAQVIPQGFQLNDLPPNIRDTIQLYDVDITLGFRPKQNDISIIANGYVTFDAGSPAKAGEKWSFNVTGSPDWSEFMTQFNGNPMSEGEAKAVMKLPELYGRVESARVTAKVNLGEALRWLRKTYDKRPTEELIAGAERQLSVLNDTLALPVDGPEAEFEQLRSELQRADTPDEISAIHRKVEAAAQKLSEGIPVRYIPAGKSDSYREARDEITRRVEIILGGLIPDESAYDAEIADYNDWSQGKSSALEALQTAARGFNLREIRTVNALSETEIDFLKGLLRKCGAFIEDDGDWNLEETFNVDGMLMSAGPYKGVRKLFKFDDQYLCAFFQPYYEGDGLAKFTLYDQHGNMQHSWKDRPTGQLENVYGENVTTKPFSDLKKLGNRLYDDSFAFFEYHDNIYYSEEDYVPTYGMVDDKWTVFFIDQVKSHLIKVTIGDQLKIEKLPSFSKVWRGFHKSLSVQGDKLILINSYEHLTFLIDMADNSFEEILPGVQHSANFAENPIVKYSGEDRFLVGGRHNSSGNWTSSLYEKGQEMFASDNRWLDFDLNGVVFGDERSDSGEYSLVRWVNGVWEKLDSKIMGRDSFLFYIDGAETVFVDALENELFRAIGRYVGSNNAFVYVRSDH